MKILFALVLASLAINSGAQNLQTVKTYYDPYSNTRIYEVYTVTPNTPTKNGSYKRYDQQGKLDAEGNFINGDKQGVWKWYENGQLEKVHTYNKGSLEGFCEIYDSKGKKIKTWYMKNEVPIKEILYYDNGKTKSLYQKTGLGGEWYENGNKKSEYSSVNDIAEGLYTDYFENGQVQSKGTYSKGHKVGKWESFYPDGGKESISEYNLDSKLTGETLWYRNNKLRSERKGIGSLQFELTNFDSISGIKQSVAKITYGSKEQLASNSDSVVNYFEGTGKNPVVSKIYKNGRRNGTWKIHFDSAWSETFDTVQAAYYRVINYNYDKIVGKVSDYYKNGRLQGLSELATDIPADRPIGNFTNYHPSGSVNDSARYDAVGAMYFNYSFNDKGTLLKSVKVDNANSKDYVYGEYDLSKTYVISWYSEKGTITKTKEVSVEAKHYWSDIGKVFAEFSKD